MKMFRDEDDQFYPVAANLTQAHEGHKLCDYCMGEGTVKHVTGGPNGPIYYSEYCDECGGEGEIEINN